MGSYNEEEIQDELSLGIFMLVGHLALFLFRESTVKLASADVISRDVNLRFD